MKYTKDDVKNMSERKQELINNYLKKFIDSRWREGDKLTYDECFNVLIVQGYIDQVNNLSDGDRTVFSNNYDVGCGGTN